jgi:hypothetical protein
MGERLARLVGLEIADQREEHKEDREQHRKAHQLTLDPST